MKLLKAYANAVPRILESAWVLNPRKNSELVIKITKGTLAELWEFDYPWGEAEVQKKISEGTLSYLPSYTGSTK